MNAGARARFCGCEKEPIKPAPGLKIWLKEVGCLTFNESEANKNFPKAIAYLNEHCELRLTPEAEAALNLSRP